MDVPEPGSPGSHRRSRNLQAIPDKLAEFGHHRASGRLGYLLAWAVVFADIGTSIYYVPGLLWNETGRATPSPAAAFVLATGLVFILLALKYVEISARYPDGGGVVSVATDAFHPMLGCLGGMLICVDYFLTGALSTVSSMHYISAEFPALLDYKVWGACGAVAFLGVLNVIGIRESAVLTAVLAISSLTINLVVVTFVAVQLDASQWSRVLAQFTSIKNLGVAPAVVGFSASWLAFSGLESISQLAPALREPRQKTALKAMLLVIACIMFTSPIITAFETALLNLSDIDVALKEKDYWLFKLADDFGPRALRLGVVLTATTLLVGAANTAIIGCYHVFLALVRLGFMPHGLAARSRRFNTPHWAILVAVTVPIAVVIGSRGQTEMLGQMYAFGLLGAFSLESLGLDRIRWQERKRGFVFYLGALTTALLIMSFCVNLWHKKMATVFGGSVTLIGVAIAYSVRRGWLARKQGIVEPEHAERVAGQLETAVEIVTLEEALDMRAMYSASTLVALRAANLRLFQEAAARARGSDENVVYLIFVDEVPGLFFPPKLGPSREAREVLESGVDFFRRAGMTAIPVWRMAHDAGASIAGAAKKLGVSAVMVGTSQRTAVWHLLRGNVLKSLVRELPATTRVWICN